MKLWTNQTVGAYCKLLGNGILIGDWRRVWKHFKPSYRWMCLRMEEKFHFHNYPSSDAPPPIWAWVKKPDLRNSGHFKPGTLAVRIEFNAPDDLVLVSNFEAWHMVLNNSIISEDEKDYDKTHPDIVVRESWKKIFNPDIIGFDRALQACMPYIKNEWVVRIDKFKAK